MGNMIRKQSFSQLCFIPHSPHTAALVALWYILGGGRMTALHAISSVPWREQGLCIFYNPFHLCNIAETLYICYTSPQSPMPRRTRICCLIIQLLICASLLNFCLSTCDDRIRRNLQPICFLKRYRNNVFTWIMLAVRKCCLWLTCLLRINIDLVDKDKINDF